MACFEKFSGIRPVVELYHVTLSLRNKRLSKFKIGIVFIQLDQMLVKTKGRKGFSEREREEEKDRKNYNSYSS